MTASIINTLTNQFDTPVEIVVPKEVLGNIFKFLPNEDLLNILSVNKNFNEATKPKCDPELATRLISAHKEAYDNCFDKTEYIITPLNGKRLLVKEEYFLKKGSWIERFSYLTGYNDLTIMKSFYEKALVSSKTWKHSYWDVPGRIKIWKQQTPQRSKAVEQLPFYTRIPVKMLSNWYLNPRIKAYCMRVWNLIQHDTRYRESNLQGILSSTVNPYDAMRTGIMVQNLDLLKFDSLKGRVLCLINAAFYTGSMLVSVPLAAISLAVGSIVFSIIFGINGLANLYCLLRHGTYHGFDTAIDKLTSFLQHTLTPYNSLAVIRSLAGAILTPSVLLMPYYNSGNCWRSLSLPNYFLDA